ncbi:MAG: hypothetical protein K2X68_06345 [Novosphingobium sp.]|nr:hypothetical protein [Novosphingobium sp.]
MRGLLRLLVYFVLLALAAAMITSYRESFERVLVQTVVFGAISLYLVQLIRARLPLLRQAWPEMLYLLATSYFAIASAIRLLDVVRAS